MAFGVWQLRLGILLPILALTLLSTPGASAQDGEGRMYGPAATAWTKWQAALDAMGSRNNAAAAETAIGDLLAENPAPFRLALMAERTELRTKQGGVLLTLQQDVANNAAGDNAKKLWAQLELGREQMNQADDGWYFASIGQFGVAAANFQALLAAKPDPVALLEFSERVQRRQQILVTLADDAIMGESVRGILALLGQGERDIKADPARIRQNIEKLAGAPRAFENAVAALKESGEYSVPFLVQTLRDPQKRHLTQPIVRMLPKLDRAGLNPMVMALRTDDQAALMLVVRALGQIPYFQSVPYLMALRDSDRTPSDIKAAAEASLSDLSARGIKVQPGMTAAEAFLELANQYYRNDNTVAADTRLTRANVWYHRDGLIQNVEVATVIFADIMAMRCCEEALKLNPDLKPALALWLASNARREAHLPEGETDATRPDKCPSATYFAQSAGTEYNLMALSRAVEDGDPIVALASIEALQRTAGSSSVLGSIGTRQPLAEALSFPDRLVRVRAGLALGSALPTQAFTNSQNLVPVLNEALALYAGSSNALVIDPDEMSANQLAAHLRGGGYNVVTDTNLFNGLNRVRKDLPGVDLLVIASNVQSPTLGESIRQIRGEFSLGFTPIIVATKKGDRDNAVAVTRGDARMAAIPADVDAAGLMTTAAAVARSSGAKTITAEVGAGLAMEAVSVVGKLALAGNVVFPIADAEKGLVGLLAAGDMQLRAAAAGVLGVLALPSGQAALAKVALTASESAEVRIRMFEALAESAKRGGNHLGADAVKGVITAAESEADLTVRTAAAQALGALNLSGNPASTIIRNQYGG